MNLSISNIAWAQEEDPQIYAAMKAGGFLGLEIAPTRIFPLAPYDHLQEARTWAQALRREWGLDVSSMQSIWYGRKERLFASDEERETLISYTRKAIDFAETIGCGNLVFGCPRNRNLDTGHDSSPALEFFRTIGGYAADHGAVIAMEANPPIYHTNYINDTPSALALVEAVASPGFRLNLDLGTMIENGEEADLLTGKAHLINHVHISEPNLKPIRPRTLHKEVLGRLLAEGYRGFISIEMGKTDDPQDLLHAISYVAGLRDGQENAQR